MNKALSDADEKWRELCTESIQHAAAMQWGLYTNAELDKALMLRGEGRLKDSLAGFLWVCHLDLNGPNNNGILEPEPAADFPPFEPDTGMLAHDVLKWSRDLATKIGMDMAELRKLYSIEIGKRAEALGSLLPLTVEQTWDEVSLAI